jgi:hypothetical protein
MFLLPSAAAAAIPQSYLDQLIARAKSLELATPYLPSTGDPLVYHAAGYAKFTCTAVFMIGLAPDFAAENVGYFTAPYAARVKLGKPVIDRTNKAVHVTERNNSNGQIPWQPRLRDAFPWRSRPNIESSSSSGLGRRFRLIASI